MAGRALELADGMSEALVMVGLGERDVRGCGAVDTASGTVDTVIGLGPLGLDSRGAVGLGVGLGARDTGVVLGRNDNLECEDSHGNEEDSLQTNGRWVFVPSNVDREMPHDVGEFNNFTNSEFNSTGRRTHPGSAGLNIMDTSNYDNCSERRGPASH